jgi:hypothetical protein
MLDDVVDFDGFDRPRRLRVDVNSISDFEDTAGLSIFELVFNTDRLRMGVIRTLLWATMKADDKKLTRERVGAMMNDYIVGGGDLQVLANALVEAINKSRLIVALSGGDPNAKRGTQSTDGEGSPTSTNG